MIIVERVEPINRVKPVDYVPRVGDKKDDKNNNEAFEQMFKNEQNQQEKQQKELKQTNKNIDTYEPSMTLDEIINANKDKNKGEINHGINNILSHRGNISKGFITYGKDGTINFGI